jgi:hypothetical protein
VFERFTERARQVVVLAQEEARTTLRHSYIGTEHILLGLLREEEGIAARVLGSFGMTLERARAEVVKVVEPGEQETVGQIPFTPRAKHVLELSLREALGLGHNYIGTEHILLGLVRENEGVAARILLGFDADAGKVRNEVLRMLAASPPPETRAPQRPAPLEGGQRPIGVAALWARVAPEIREHLGREADAGDLLALLASIPDSLLARTLAELEVDEARLDAALARARTHGPSPFEERVELLRIQQADAEAEGDEFAAAQLRAEELRARREHGEQLLSRVRMRLRLSQEPPPGAGKSGPP